MVNVRVPDFEINIFIQAGHVLVMMPSKVFVVCLAVMVVQVM